MTTFGNKYLREMYLRRKVLHQDGTKLYILPIISLISTDTHNLKHAQRATVWITQKNCLKNPLVFRSFQQKLCWQTKKKCQVITECN